MLPGIPCSSYNMQNQITTGAPQTGFRCDPSAAVRSAGKNTAPGTDIRAIGTLKSFDEAARQGYREDYSIQDAAESLWRKETQTIHLKDLEDPEKSKEFLENWRLQARWDLGIQGGPTKDEVISAYIQGLRQNGLSGEVDFSVLTRELASFKATTPEELEDGLDYVASRYVALLDKLERNFQGEELAARTAKLEEVYQAGKAEMINGYTQFLQDNLGLSDSNAQTVRDSLSAILAGKEEACRSTLKQVHEAVEQAGPDSLWLQNHDAYIASQLRAASTAGMAGESQPLYSVQDLAAAGQIAQSYQKEIAYASSLRNEAVLALDLSMADMKAETMISQGLVSENMAALLRESRAQGHENVLSALNQALARRENTRAPGEPKGTFAPVDRAVFQGIYRATMDAYRQNGGDAVKAIQAGVSAGQKLTAQAAAKAPKAARWGNSIKSYWQEFYKTPETRTPSRLDTQMNNLLILAGRTARPPCSAYQQYVTSWQDFLTSMGGGVDVRA